MTRSKALLKVICAQLASSDHSLTTNPDSAFGDAHELLDHFKSSMQNFEPEWDFDPEALWEMTEDSVPANYEAAPEAPKE